MAIMFAWPGALFIGLTLGMVGSGGSILTVPILVYLVGQEERVAIAGSLAIVGLISLFAALPYARERLIDWRCVVLFGIPGMFGTYMGAAVSAFVPGIVQLAAFAIVMLMASWFMLRPPAAVGAATPVLAGADPVTALADGSSASGPRHRSVLRIAGEGLTVGAVTGFVGVGGGFLIVPALVLLGGLRMHVAIGTSLVIIAMKSAVGFSKYLEVLEHEHLALDLGVIAVFVALGVVGSLAGAHLGNRISQERLRTIFGVLLVVMGIGILGTSLPEVLAATASN